MNKLLQIVKGCYRHDRLSQRSFYERYYGYALKISFRYMDSYEEATQLTNDTFLTIFRNFSCFGYDDKNNVDVYLTEWIKTKMIEAIIRDLKMKIALYQPDHIPNPYRKCQHQLFPETPALYDQLIAVLRELPPILRAVFNLHVIDLYPQTEIAKIFGISLQTTVSYIQIARQLCIKPFLTAKSSDR